MRIALAAVAVALLASAAGASAASSGHARVYFLYGEQLVKVPRPGGSPAEVLLDRQVTLLIVGNKVARTIAVSSGKASTPTPPGSYRVYAKIRRWWSTPFREWLPFALPFVGGIAFHEVLDVPSYPASHGCVRQPPVVARWTYAFAEVGMPVKVIASS